MRVLGLTLLTMVAFAANSVLCRMALDGGLIDAGSFSALRLATGALMLVAIAAATRRGAGRQPGGGWVSGLLLALYAVPFSFAYVALDAGTGALVLIGAVQITMITAAVLGGERPRPLVWCGMALAAAGLLVLLAPGLAAPSPVGAALMGVAGLGWGLYSLRGRAAGDPVARTAAAFVRATPVALGCGLVALGLRGASVAHLSARGIALASFSGAVTSGLGYVAWYRVLPQLSTTGAAVVQLSVPVLAAIGGVLFIAEAITPRLAMAASMILGGIGLVLRVRSGAPRS
ncbi:MAG: DMT family transporter [Candidatus Eiseniibacteriota bacterium]|jgi:drug/metabolite transporter (DMT)-like permease